MLRDATAGRSPQRSGPDATSLETRGITRAEVGQQNGVTVQIPGMQRLQIGDSVRLRIDVECKGHFAQGLLTDVEILV
jgi:hypothetical protein